MSSTYLKAVARKGRALLGMGRAREAAAAFSEGLKADPLDPGLKAGLQEAERAVLADLVEGAPRYVRHAAHAVETLPPAVASAISWQLGLSSLQTCISPLLGTAN